MTGFNVDSHRMHWSEADLCSSSDPLQLARPKPWFRWAGLPPTRPDGPLQAFVPSGSYLNLFFFILFFGFWFIQPLCPPAAALG